MRLYQHRILVLMPDGTPAAYPSVTLIPHGSGGMMNTSSYQGNSNGIIYIPLNETRHKDSGGSINISASINNREYFGGMATGKSKLPLTIFLREDTGASKTADAPKPIPLSEMLVAPLLDLIKTAAKEATTPLPQSLAQDPSTLPICEREDAGSQVYSERYRIVADLDGDGANDLILSAAVETLGKMGGPWTVYLSREGKFNPVGTITAHPKAISLEPDQDRNRRDPNEVRYARIWVYLRDNGPSGGLGYYRVGEKTVKENKGLIIYPGDGGSDLGREIYTAVFKTSPIKFNLERSRTTPKGEVTWAVDAQ